VTRAARIEPLSARWTKPTLSASTLRAVAARRVARSRARRAPFVLLVCGLLAGGLCALVALNTASAAAELRRHELQTTNAGLAEDVQQLRSRVAADEAPGALAAAAAKLGMVPNGTPAFLTIRPDGTVGVLGSPSPASAAAAPAPVAPRPTATATRPPSPASTGSAHAASGLRPTGTPTSTPKPTPQTTPKPTPSPTPVTQAPLPGGPR
jgi:hypothetical protein